MDQNLKLVAYLHLAFGALGIAGAVALATIMFVAGAASGDPGAFAVLSGIGGVLAVFIAALSVPSLAGGWGLLQYREWARVLVVVLSCFNLLNVPIGTLLGGFSLYVLLNDETKRLIQAGGPNAAAYLPR